MLIEYEHNARVFAEWAEQSGFSRVDQINASCLEKYKTFILRLANPDFAAKAETWPLGAVAIHKRLARLKILIKWAWETDQLVLLPRNLKKLAKVETANRFSEAERADNELFWTVDECRQMFGAATPRTKLFMLLGLNCGYTQSDIACLLHAHFEWDSSVVSRPRKTGMRQVHKL